MSELPPVRRVVTGHDLTGKAIIDSDTLLPPFDPRAIMGDTATTEEEKRMASGGGFVHVWRTEQFPASNQPGPWTDYHNRAIPLADKTGTTIRVVDMPPGLSSPMHRTVSLDMGVVLSSGDQGVVLELDDGVEVTLKPGEVCMQRGTIHAWHNRGSTTARILFVLLPADEVVVDGQKLESTRFGVN